MPGFTALAYNLYFGGTGREAEIAAVLAHSAPDVAALTEADDPGVVERLAARAGMQFVWGRGSGDRHIALLSRHPVREWRVHNHPPLTQAALAATIEAPGFGPLTVVAVHLLPYLLLPFEIRRWQAVGKLLEIIRQDSPGPHLILGDLNAIAPGDRVLQRNNPAKMRRVMALQAGLIFRLAIPRLLRAGYVDCYRARHNDDGFTWMTGNPTTRYDYVFASPDLAAHLRACRVLDDHPAVGAASDHYPLLARFEWGGEQADGRG